MVHEDKHPQQDEHHPGNSSKRRTSYAPYTIHKKSKAEEEMDNKPMDDKPTNIPSPTNPPNTTSSSKPSQPLISPELPPVITTSPSQYHAALQDIKKDYTNNSNMNVNTLAPVTPNASYPLIFPNNNNQRTPTLASTPKSTNTTTTTTSTTRTTNIKPAPSNVPFLSPTFAHSTNVPSPTTTQTANSSNRMKTTAPSSHNSVYTNSLSGYSPEDSVNEIVGDVKYREKLFANEIYSIRQLAGASEKEMPTIKSDLYLQLLQDAARQIVVNSIVGAPAEPLPAIWVYHYVGEEAYSQIKNERILKSAFVLYSEYLEFPIETRIFHPWVRVYRAYARDAAEWLQPKKNVKLVTDLDVFSFLVWRAAPSFAKYDCTAGPKAIYFNWEPIPEPLRQQCVAVDAVIAKDTKNDDVADRYAHVIRINLTSVVKHCEGKIYRVEPTNKNNWVETSLEGSICMKGRGDLWDNFIPGGPYFQDVPHGCIVTSLGQIPGDYLELDWVPPKEKNEKNEKNPKNPTTTPKNSAFSILPTNNLQTKTNNFLNEDMLLINNTLLQEIDLLENTNTNNNNNNNNSEAQNHDTNNNAISIMDYADDNVYPYWEEDDENGNNNNLDNNDDVDSANNANDANVNTVNNNENNENNVDVNNNVVLDLTASDFYIM